jgi:hypothetical protein
LPFTTLLFFAFGMGAAAALAAEYELCLSPRPVVLSASFAAFAAFMLLLLVPVSVYFYVFHGDWFMLYLVEVMRVPSALALLGFATEFAVGLSGFGLAAACVRNQHNAWVMTMLGVCVIGAAAVVGVCPDRLRAVGTLRQYQGGFGLVPYGGTLLQGALAMGGLLVVGGLYLLFRIRRGQARIQRS